MRHLLLLSLPATLLTGCFVECGAGTEEINKTCVPVVTEDTASAASTPVILAFAANVATIEQGESVTFTAVVTHPEGIENVIGGVLQSGSGATYGAFSTAADEGAYSLSVSWWDTNQVNSINLDSGSDGNRPFVATFFDLEGDSASAELDVGITCDGEPSCEGICGTTCSSGGDSG